MTSDRKVLCDRMADDLSDLPAFAGERDAIRILMASPKLYRLGDITILAEEALHEARRRASATEEHNQ